MAIGVTRLRVFTDSVGDFGNRLGVVDASGVDARDRQHLASELSYSATIVVDLPPAGSTTAYATIYTRRDEATGSAAMRITDHLSRNLHITQGRGSQIDTTWNREGWVGVADRVVSDGVTQRD
jgi:predicted PhzF superfamily epimerase YddE/YHI9